MVSIDAGIASSCCLCCFARSEVVLFNSHTQDMHGDYSVTASSPRCHKAEFQTACGSKGPVLA